MGNYTLINCYFFFFCLIRGWKDLARGEWIVCILIGFSVLEIDAFRVEFSIIGIGSERKK